MYPGTRHYYRLTEAPSQIYQPQFWPIPPALITPPQPYGDRLSDDSHERQVQRQLISVPDWFWKTLPSEDQKRQLPVELVRCRMYNAVIEPLFMHYGPETEIDEDLLRDIHWTGEE